MCFEGRRVARKPERTADAAVKRRHQRCNPVLFSRGASLGEDVLGD